MDVLYSPELCLISDKFLYLRHEQNAGNNAGARLNSFNEGTPPAKAGGVPFQLLLSVLIQEPKE